MSGYVSRIVSAFLPGKGSPRAVEPGGTEGPVEPAVPPGDGRTGEGQTGRRAERSEPATVAEPQVEPGCTPEEYVRRLLDRNGGCLAQQTVLARLGWSEPVGRKLLRSMEADGAIDRHHPPGRRKRVALPGDAPWRGGDTPDAG